MLARRQKNERTFAPITPEFHTKRNRNTWYAIGTAIILISIVIAIALGMWSAMT